MITRSTIALPLCLGTLVLLGLVLAGTGYASAAEAKGDTMNGLVGQPVDIAPSAYQYRSERKAEENPPESWLALMHYASQPVNRPLDRAALPIRQALCGLLWEEIRHVERLELTWAPGAARRPAPGDLVLTTLDHKGSASSWWNNLGAKQLAITPSISQDGNTYVYALEKETCGVVISVGGAKTAADVDTPRIRALAPELWKTMSLEVEWGFNAATVGQDYSGHMEAYDGRVSELRALDGDARTTTVGALSWQSSGPGVARRGVQLSLLYMGTSTWRPLQPFTSQPEDVARTIVTLWTAAGNVSFLAADLENGPILAPEYGFFVRRTSALPPSPAESAPDRRAPRLPLTDRMASLAGSTELLGWGSDATPWFGGNPSDRDVSVLGIALPGRSLAMHPGQEQDVAVGWRSPIRGSVRVEASIAHAQAGGNGIDWWIAWANEAERRDLDHGATDGSGSQAIPSADAVQKLSAIAVEPGEMVSLVVGPKGAHPCDTTRIRLVITEVGGAGRVWDLTSDVVSSLAAGNPHADGQGNADVWHFYALRSAASPSVPPPLPPLALASEATGAKAFIEELRARGLTTVRQRTRAREEQTWEGAVTGLCDANPPPHPVPPAGSEPPMEVQVPSARLTAQWKLGAWHLLRHAERHPETGRLWFNDHPYGILAAETYMVLRALDVMGVHKAAEDGFEQWVSLPLDPNSTGHHSWALPDRPNGLFSEGHGCLTHAIGPPGYGGHMDGVHAFGPGAIGWALTEHYWMSGNAEWLKAAAPRLVANAEWMLRQRRLMAGLLPGGERLWCKGLQPALQVTPDSGGLWMQFYECEAYYWISVARLAATLAVVDPEAGVRLNAEAEAYRQDLRAAVERSIALSPVVPVRDGTFHSVVPFACYVRGLGTGAWGWQRDGSGRHVGPLYWETVQSAAALVSPAGLLAPDDVRVQGYLDVLEDRLLLDNTNVAERCRADWFLGGWQYQGGLERTSNMHLAGDDIPVFLRSFLNCYAIDILPASEYIFSEHAFRGPPDKIFEEAAFLERFRSLLVMEDGESLWLARATPRLWLEQGQRVSVKQAPSHFGTVDFELVSDVDNGKITATVRLPSRSPAQGVLLRLRHPRAVPLRRVTVNGAAWTDFDAAREVVLLRQPAGTVKVEALYAP